MDSLRRLYQDFNPPSPCGEGRARPDGSQDREKISIHPPRAGRDLISLSLSLRAEIFQSTLPVRGGTRQWLHQLFQLASNFNPPSPCGEGRHTGHELGICTIISIHPPRAGRATLPVRGGTAVWSTALPPWTFQSTLPVRGGTNPALDKADSYKISIHPPRAGRDRAFCSGL